MDDNKKLTIAVLLSFCLLLSTVLYNVFQDYLQTHLFSYIQRRIYYERVISKKDLSHHRARYWRRLEQTD